MNEFLWKRIERKLAALPDDRVYQVLDYVEFLEARYATQREGEASPLQRIAERVEDTLRAGRVPVAAIKTTMDAMSAAGRLMGGLAAAGKAVVDEVTAAAASPAKPSDLPPRPEAKDAPADGGASSA